LLQIRIAQAPLDLVNEILANSISISQSQGSIFSASSSAASV
jgi:hypothetical protein